MAGEYSVRRKRSGVITLIVFLLLAAVVLFCCLMFIQNYIIFTADGIRFDFSQQQTTKPLDVVVNENRTEELFAPIAAPTVSIEKTELPPG